MTDEIIKVRNSVIQYGKENNRVYLMKLSKSDCSYILKYVNNLALEEGLTKIFAKVPTSLQGDFFNDGYIQEAFVKKFFKGEENCHFLCKYFSSDRQEFYDKEEIEKIKKICFEKERDFQPLKLDGKFSIKQLAKNHAVKMTKIYKTIFKSYPFPIFDPGYIKKTMAENIDYFGAFCGNSLVAVSSCEMDLENLNSEMTDFAVLPEYRGHNIAYYLLQSMEAAAKSKGIKTFYTIARAKSAGMNITFAKSNYTYSGALVNNTNISGSIETMNVWYKNI
ncbi:MAG: putative beta-lysine N-acetyltransferase [Candidatus Gastranaerophilales bacterium]|nr:putative beta-lysine N-acetyltransferase [Candidatus Gastranaerophilales bacterium]